jgi:hypothetical protein
MKHSLYAVVAICGVALLCPPAHATTTYSISPATVTAAPGDTGDSFDVMFTNNGPGSLSVAAFAFEVSVADPDITLTGASYSTVVQPYIFAGNSLFQMNSIPLGFCNLTGCSPQTMDALDVTNDGSGVTVAPGQSADLGTILFNVANPAQAGPFTVSFTGQVSDVANANNLSDPLGNGISVDFFSSGTIDVAPVPLPSSLLLTLLGLPIVFLAAFRRRTPTSGFPSPG